MADPAMTEMGVILKGAPIGSNPDDYSVVDDGVVVGRIFLSPAAPQDRQWMWTSGHSADSIKRAAHGYEPTREADGPVFRVSRNRNLGIAIRRT
jgi:hypothetical protein